MGLVLAACWLTGSPGVAAQPSAAAAPAAAPTVPAAPAGPAAVRAAADLAQAEALIQALVARGLLPRSRGDVLVREARVRAGVVPSTVVPSREALRAEVRQEVKQEVLQEVLAQARALSTPAPTPSAPQRATPATAVARAAGATSRPTPTASAADVAPASPAAAAAPPLAPSPVTAAAPGAAAGAAAGASVPAPVAGVPAAAGPAPVAAPDPTVIRVPYVPQVVRDQIRNQLREEVLAKARTEGWGSPPGANAATPASWADRIKLEGDLRVRWQSDQPDAANIAPVDLLAASFERLTRAPDLAAGTRDNVATGNTREDRERLRLRARLGVSAQVTDQVGVGLRLATGSATDRVSTNQTLGQNANRYTFLLERAFVRLDPVPWASLQAGRMPNPWFATDLQWSENLHFEGVSGTLRWPMSPQRRFEPFLTLGWFPLREDAPPSSSRSLAGAQIGFQWDLQRTRWRFGLAQYRYRNLEGRIDGDYDATLRLAGPSYGQFEYTSALRQRGNTLFLTNNPAEGAAGADLTPDRFRWGLASRFTPVALTLAAELNHFAPWVLSLSGEAVRNTAFDRAEIRQRTGLQLTDGSASGFALRAVFGSASVRQRGDWQLSLGYRRLGSDAVLDAFVDSDVRGGGTNLSGISAGLLWGLDRDLSLGLRYLNGRSLDPVAPRPGGAEARPGGYSLSTWQVDLGARF